jgi:hypothetical protein
MQRSKRRKINSENDVLKAQFLEAYLRRIAEEVFDENPNLTSINKGAVERAQQNIAKKFIKDWVAKDSVSGE